MTKLYLFDFDGTITKKDSLFLFLKFTSPTWKWFVGLAIFSLPFILAKGGALSRGYVKERFISFFLKGRSKKFLDIKAKEFLAQLVQTNAFRSTAIDELRLARERGEVSIVSASLDIWMNAIADYLQVNLICTKAKFDDNIFSGKFDGANCNYNEKPIQVLKAYNLKSFDNVVYYGDSIGDLAMKDIVDEFHMRRFGD